MRTDPSAFATKNVAAAKSPRFVIKIEYSSPLYLSSHTGISGVPATHLEAILAEPSIASQKLNPDQGRAEIGAASFTIADKSSVFTNAVQSRLAAGEGLRGRTCRFYLGYEGLAWSAFVLVGTQIVKDAAYDRGSYRVSCNDIQRSARKDIFDPKSTTLAATAEATDTTLTVASTAGFETVEHGTSWSDSPSSTVGYLKIKDEVIRYTGKTSTTFTGCTRGALGTTAARYVVEAATPTSRREKVSEYIYLELPGPKLAYAILTGLLYGDSATLPSHWHLAIDDGLIRTADFTGIGADLWDPTDDEAGIVVRFEGLAKADGKAFIELELMRLMGLYMPVYADGTLGLRRMTRVLSDASGVVTLDESNSVAVGDLEHDMETLHNAFSVQWNWNGKDFTRTTTYLDAGSVAIHGQAPTMDLKFKGLYGGRHTDGLIFSLLGSIRDRYGAPPVRLRVDVLHSLNTIEVGDVVRCIHHNVRDFTQPEAHIDRAFEVQSVTVNHRTGAVSLDLFGSTANASVDPPITPTTALPDAFYTSAGTNLASVWTITSGVVSGGPYTLAGSTTLGASGSIWYYDGDLTIPQGVTVNLTGNVQIRVKGYLTVNGAINGTGGGWAGVADNTSATTILDGNPGWVGNSRGLDGCNYALVFAFASTEYYLYGTQPPAITQALHASFPYVELEVDGNTLLGLPSDLRGTGGGPGGKVIDNSTTFRKAGGTGAAGGAGLCTITRGFGVGSGATITLSGNSSAAQTVYTTDGRGFLPGTGGAGGPGSFLCLIDGGLLSVPDFTGRFVARTGTVAIPTYRKRLDSAGGRAVAREEDSPMAGYLGDPSVISAMDLSYSCLRIQYVPVPEDPSDDTDTLAPVTSVTTSQSSSGYVVTFNAPVGAPASVLYEVWDYTSATPFSSATRRAEGASTAFFIPRPDTNTVYVWVRAKFRDDRGLWIYSAESPTGNGVPAKAAANAGTYATATPSSIAASTASATVTTGSVTAGLVGDTPTSYSWTRVSGSTSISANSASAATTTFTATSVGTGVTLSALFRCTINSTYTIDVPVSCTNSGSALRVTASPTSVSKTEDAATITTASVTATGAGGAGGYTYAWTKVSGGSISAVSASAATTTFQGTTMTASESRSAVFRCTVTDSASATATVDVNVSVTRAGLSLSLSPTVLYRSSTNRSITSGSVTATASNGVAPYSYAWTYVSGDTMTINSPSSASTTFTGAVPDGQILVGTFRCTATDSTSPTPLTATADITVTLVSLREPPGEPL